MTHLLTLKCWRKSFPHEGYEVLAFPHGEMALRAAFQEPPDLILLDIMMPAMDGFAVCEQLKADENLRGIPVIFISALDDTASKVKAFSHGGVDYVTKPFQEEEVCARVATHLKLRWTQLEVEKYNDHLEDLVEAKVKEISDSHLATLVAISCLSEVRDDETGKHIERTQTLCKLLAQKLRENPRYTEMITDAYIQNIYYAAPLHDIGKIGIPDSILLKPGKLSPDEFEIMKTHVSLGADALEKIRFIYPKNEFINIGLSLTRSHHEKWDGTGYPAGLRGEEIPLAARIMALADVYDALRSKRSYKKAFSHEQTVKIIQGEAGKHFDPTVVDAFLSIESTFAAIFDEINLQVG